MDAFEINKIAGAVLAALLVIFATRTISDLVFEHHTPEKPGYEIAVADTGTSEGSKGTEEKVKPLGARLASADIDRGKKVAKKCKACHTFDKGGKTGVGPNLYDIVARKMAAVSGFAYSSALSGKGGTWSFDELECFIANPKKCFKGTKMAFKGISKPQDRADLILYLRSLSDKPAALPQPGS